VCLERGKQRAAHAAPLDAGAHRHRFQPQRRFGAAELSLEFSRQHIADQSSARFGGELQVQLGLGQRRLEPALEIEVAGSSAGRGIDRDYR